MPFLPESIGRASRRTALLIETVELLVNELSALANQSWDELPALKKKKVELASRLRLYHAESGAPLPEPADGMESMIAELEDQSHGKIQARLDLIGKQILALQELHLYWLECLHVSFRMFTKQPVA
jgi:hypothetical protein